MIKTGLFPGRYIQGPKAIMRVNNEVKRYGGNGFMIATPSICKRVLPNIKSELSQGIELVIEEFKGECCDKEIDRLTQMAKSASVIIGIGGGKTLDTAKAVAYNLQKSIIIVPSLASSDAPCSALSVIYKENGAFDRYLVLPQNPNVVIVDTEIIAKAPARFLAAGMGDALATFFEADSCRQSFSGNMTGDCGPMTSFALAELCLQTLLENGEMALRACESQAATPALEKIVEANTLLSGLGFESGGLGAAHAIHNGFTVLDETHEFFHGEKVAFGTLASLILTDKPRDLIDQIYYFCESVNLPTTLAEIGLKNASDEAIMRVAEASCAEGETIHNEACPICAQAIYAAIKTADAIGRQRKEM